MPGLDHKGPENEGPRTGRGLGNCGKPSDTRENEDFNQANQNMPGRGLARGHARATGRGRGLGRGQRNGRGRGLNR